MTATGRLTRLIYSTNVVDVASTYEAEAAALIDQNLEALRTAAPAGLSDFTGHTFTGALESRQAEHALIDAFVAHIHRAHDGLDRHLFSGVLGRPKFDSYPQLQKPEPLGEPRTYSYVVDEPGPDGTWREVCAGQEWAAEGPVYVAEAVLSRWTREDGRTEGRRVCVWAGQDWYTGDPDHLTAGDYQGRPSPSLLDEPEEDEPGPGAIEDVRVANVYGEDGVARPAILVTRRY
ncbi:hypothetical protein ABZX72_35585 [Streptomyces cyaneofuscatus]|uniref:hypothetical protein n=1 Tax=Streptomyces cyaneofuscatus TaxID=66883 RepID=UPI0033B19D13